MLGGPRKPSPFQTRICAGSRLSEHYLRRKLFATAESDSCPVIGIPKQGMKARLSDRLTRRVAKLSVVASITLLWLFAPWSLASLASSAIRNGIAVLAVLTRVPDAISLVHQERDRTAAERDAFESFARRVSAIEMAESRPPRATDTRQGPAALSAPTKDDRRSAPMAEIEQAYRETVMDVSHYEQEYDEPLPEHLANEFGTEIGIAVSRSDTLTPQLREALIDASIRSRDERVELLEQLDDESQRLQAASTSLEELCEAVNTVEASLAHRADCELADAWERLEDLEGDCRTLLRDRQCRLDGSDGDPSLQEYLYTPREWTYPILGDGLAGVDRVRRAKRRVVATILRRG